MRIVLDTNILLASIGRRSPLRWLFDALIDGSFTLLVSTPILLEYEEVTQRMTTVEIAHNLLRALLLLPNCERVEPRFRWTLIKKDPDDNKFVDAALAGGADALVTHDAHFDAVRDLEFPPLKIVSAAEFHDALARAR